MQGSGMQKLVLISIILSFCILILVIRFSPQEVIRLSPSKSGSLLKFQVIDLPISEHQSEEAKTHKPKKVINFNTMNDHPLTTVYQKTRGDPKRTPKNLYHEGIDYDPFVLPPPIRVKSMDFRSFSQTSAYYKELQRASLSCNKDICQDPVHFLNQFAQWDCKKHPSLCQDKGQFLVLEENKYLYGDIDIIENGIINIDYDCGWPANHSNSLIEPANQIYGHFEGSLVFLNVPQGLSFQHFIDGVLPKLVQLKKLIKEHDEYYFALDHSFVDQLPLQLLERIGIPSNRIIDFRSLSWVHNRIKVDTLILGCRVPPLHPHLWMKAQEMLRLPWLQKDWVQTRHIILYFSRNKGTRNNGRRVINEDEITNTISQFANKNHYEFDVFSPEKYDDLDSLFDYLANVDIVIGPHGGAFYNILFMRRNIKVIEFMPESPEFVSLRWAVHLIIYLQSMLLGNNYYNIQGEYSGDNNMNIDPSILLDVLKDCLL